MPVTCCIGIEFTCDIILLGVIYIYAKGKVVKTKAGEITIDVADFQLLTKSIRPLPSKWHGLRDVEERYRKRYLDMIINPWR